MWRTSQKKLWGGDACIGRVTFSKSGRTLYYGGQTFKSLRGSGYKANYYDVDTLHHYWISGPRKDGLDRLYDERPIAIDDDIRREYWTEIRGLSDQNDQGRTSR